MTWVAITEDESTFPDEGALVPTVSRWIDENGLRRQTFVPRAVIVRLAPGRVAGLAADARGAARPMVLPDWDDDDLWPPPGTSRSWWWRDDDGDTEGGAS